MVGSMAWLLAMTAMTMLMGGLTHYLSTGEQPKELKDWFYPKGPDGKRRAIPTYWKTIISAELHPVRTIGGITAPLNAILWRTFITNMTFSGEVIRDPSDPWMKQAWDALRMAASEGYQPFVSQTRKSGLGKAESLMGVTAAPAEINRSKAENYLHDVLPPAPPRSHEEEARSQARRDLREALQSKDGDRVKAAVKSGALSERSMLQTQRNAARSSLQNMYERASLGQAIRAYELATPDERAEVRPILGKKWYSLLPQTPMAQRKDLSTQYKAAVRLPYTHSAAR